MLVVYPLSPCSTTATSRGILAVLLAISRASLYNVLRYTMEEPYTSHEERRRGNDASGMIF